MKPALFFPPLASSLCALLLLSSIAAADQTYPIRLRAAVGEKWTFDVNSTMKQKGQLIADGQPQPLDREISARRKGTVEIVAVDHDAPTAMTITYDAESSNSGTLGAGQPLPPFPLAGKTVHLKKQNGTVTNDLGKDIDPQTVQEVNHMMDPDISIYPKDPVAVNQEWNGDTTFMARQYELGPADQASLKCQLIAVKEVNGRQVADVDLNGLVVKHEEGFVETRITLTGMSRIDLQTGQTLQGKLTGKTTSRGESTVPGPTGAPIKVSVNATGDIMIHQLLTLSNAPQVPAVAVTPPPTPAPVPAPVQPQPVPPPAPADGPLTTFAGDYTGDQIHLTLNADGTGTLTVAGKNYPVTSRLDAGKLAGTFTSAGTPFAFTASLESSILTLTSEGNTYTLKKTATPPPSRNPLAR